MRFMRRRPLLALILLILSILFFCGGLRAGEVGHASPYTNIDVDTAYVMITNGTYPQLVTLDVRTKSEYDTGHVYGTLWIPVDELESRIAQLSPHVDNEIIVYCRSGARSATASGILDSHNFTKVYNMLGGINAWSYAGHPVWVSTIHNLDTGINYDTIQTAIDASQTLDGHTVLVDEGVYYEHVVVNKSVALVGESSGNTVVDGNGTGTILYVTCSNVNITGFTVQNSESYWQPNAGIRLENNVNGCLIAGNNIRDNVNGFLLICSYGNMICENSVTNNTAGLFLWTCKNNTIFGNNITNNDDGIVLDEAADNIFYHNNINNTNSDVSDMTPAYPSTCDWDNGLEGNYWARRNYTDANRDGIGDTGSAKATDNLDRYPLMGLFSSFATQTGHQIDVVSNSTIEQFEYFEANGTIRLFASNATSDQTFGFCRMRIPRALMNGTLQVEIRGTEWFYANFSIFENEQSRWIYMSYGHSAVEIIIIPELPWPPLLMLLPVTLLIAFVARRRKDTNLFRRKALVAKLC